MLVRRARLAVAAALLVAPRCPAAFDLAGGPLGTPGGAEIRGRVRLGPVRGLGLRVFLLDEAGAPRVLLGRVRAGPGGDFLLRLPPGLRGPLLVEASEGVLDDRPGGERLRLTPGGRRLRALLPAWSPDAPPKRVPVTPLTHVLAQAALRHRDVSQRHLRRLADHLVHHLRLATTGLDPLATWPRRGRRPARPDAPCVDSPAGALDAAGLALQRAALLGGASTSDLLDSLAAALAPDGSLEGAGAWLARVRAALPEVEADPWAAGVEWPAAGPGGLDPDDLDPASGDELFDLRWMRRALGGVAGGGSCDD